MAVQTRGAPIKRLALHAVQSKPGTLLSALPERFNASTCRRIAPSVDDHQGPPLSNRMICQSFCLSVQPSAVLRLSPDGFILVRGRGRKSSIFFGFEAS